ncbi:purple acid phosphatase family protein [Lunatimonas salinarum]|uniref:purple acid phosphatase family protein n=1 Tax=Lunatimonas salinarum TaxID=1774590 RepID=UPI001ADEC587|nr:metallophosphoesterase family protein [Lunatimonas salinarum]
MFKKPFVVGILIAILGSCTERPTHTNHSKTLTGIMDDLVSRFYEQFDKPTLDTISESFIRSYLTEEEKQVMATQYWVIRVNVPVTVSLMRDKDQKTVPFWLEESGFNRTDLQIKNTHSTYEVWQKDFSAGEINLGINGFDKHRPVYFISLAPKDASDLLEIEPVFPETQHIEPLEVGAFTYHDWDGLTLTEVPQEMKGQSLLTTIRGRAREAHLIGAFRTTDFPSSGDPDQIMLTWSGDTQNAVDIQWRTNPSVKEGLVRYWKVGSTDTLTQTANASLMEDRLLENDRYIHRFTTTLQELTPATHYSYQVGSVETGWSNPESFQTAGEKNAPFSFIWFGDVHNTDQWGDLIHQADQRHQDNRFYIIAGDLVNTGLHRDDWDQLFGFAGKTIARRPLMTVPGNHDSQDGLGAWMFEDMFSYPDNGPEELPSGRSYYFTYQNALYIMLDATLPLSKQSAWMEQVLKNNPADWKFVVTHFPPYNAVEPYEDIIAEWVPIFDRYEVDMVMGGHFHYYMRSKPLINSKINSDKGTRYVISIGTKGKNKEAEKGSYAEVQFAAEFLYQYMEIQGKTLRYTVYDLDGTIRDQFTLTKD